MVAFSHSSYIKWVQRSINFYFVDCRLNVSGSITPEYRNAVSDVQFEQYIAETGDVGPTTQNALIKSNHDSREYTSWVQTNLNALMSKRLGSTFIDGSTQSAIKDFQKTFGKTYSGGLAIDGWFGYKTELVMIELTKSTPPARCFTFSDEPVIGTRKCLVRKLPGLRGIKTKNRLANCMLKKLLDPSAKDDFLDLSLTSSVIGAAHGTVSEFDAFTNLRDEIKKMIVRRKKAGLTPMTCNRIEAWIVGKAEDLTIGVHGLLVADPFIPAVPKLRKLVHELSMNKKSFYHCPAAKEAVNRMVDKVGKNLLGRLTYKGSVA